MGTQFEAFRSNPDVAEIIKMKAWKLSQHPLFRKSDKEDIECDMWSHLFEWCDRYTPERGTMQAFVNMLMDTWAAMEIRARKRLKRQPDFQMTSINTTMIECDGDKVPLSTVLSFADAFLRIRSSSLSDSERKELVEALVVAIRQLTPEQCQLLDDKIELGVEQAAQKHGISQSTLNRRIQAMRQFFEKAGLGRG